MHLLLAVLTTAIAYGLPTTELQKLQRVQNAAASWLICNVVRFDHISPTLKMLRWLPVKYRIDFIKILLITYKAIHGLAPAYLSELITLDYSLRSSSEQGKVENSFISTGL